jgi:hypothetical protein
LWDDDITSLAIEYLGYPLHLPALLQAFLNLPNWAKALFAFIGIVGLIAGYETLQSNSNPAKELISQGSKSPDLKDVNIIVRTKESQPEANVKVEIISKGPPTSKTTDSNGYVEIQIPSRETVEIILSKPGYEDAKYLINLATDPNTTKTLYIKPVAPQKRIKKSQ